MNSMQDTPKKNLMPSGMQKANNVEKRIWLHNQMSKIFDTYVSGTLSGVTETKESVELCLIKVPCHVELLDVPRLSSTQSAE